MFLMKADGKMLFFHTSTNLEKKMKQVQISKNMKEYSDLFKNT